MAYMKRITGVVAAVMLLIMVCSCTADESYSVTAQSLCMQLNSERSARITEPLTNTIAEYGMVEQSCPDEFTSEEVAKLVTAHTYKSEITIEEALDDTDTLMRIFKTSYGAYGYFGGDSVFNAAYDRIDERLRASFTDGVGSTAVFHTILLDELSFIEDSHLRIGGKCTAFKEKLIYFDNSQMNYCQDKHGFYTLIDDKKLYLSKDDEQYLRLTVSDDGSLVYGLFIITTDETALPAEITLSSRSGKEHRISLSWTVASAGTADRRVHNYSEIDSIPVTSLSRMSINSGDLPLTNDFINEAEQLKNEKVFILDLRSNNGGLVYINDIFMYALTGSRCCFKSQTVKRYSPLNLHHDKVNNDYIGGNENFASLEPLDFFRNNRELVKSWYADVNSSVPQSGRMVVKDTTASMTPYENTIIVLVDKNTVSAGEYFLFELSTVENVIIMGTNSAGCLITGDVNLLSGLYLPCSGISVTYGQVLMLNDYADGFDSSGFMPDVISRSDALCDAVALAKTIN